ncbi:hypothetical protein [Vagococcus fessus]|uniref:hypothetical protein n=1 Tax=Vagococcus fessus TaxID=120370 RepID=UPI001474E86A|nr:hypothetical protein [Vagococcus fessus]
MISEKITKVELIENLEEVLEEHEEKVNSSDCLELGEFRELYLELYRDLKRACKVLR